MDTPFVSDNWLMAKSVFPPTKLNVIDVMPESCQEVQCKCTSYPPRLDVAAFGEQNSVRLAQICGIFAKEVDVDLGSGA